MTRSTLQRALEAGAARSRACSEADLFLGFTNDRSIDALASIEPGLGTEQAWMKTRNVRPAYSVTIHPPTRRPSERSP